MEDNFKFEIISPEKIIFSGEATMATFPSYEGDMSILKNHVSIITFLRPGVVKVETKDKSIEEFFIEEGTVEFFDNSLVLLSASVINFKNLSKEFVDNLNNETQEKLNNEDIKDNERYLLNHKLNILKEIRI
jgi:F-type H+-transporting ATPase subunit epsilon